MVFVQTTRQIYRDLLQHVQSLPVLRSSVEERWWEISYRLSLRSWEDFTFIGASRECRYGPEDRRHRKSSGGGKEDQMIWLILVAFSTRSSHLTVPNPSRLTAGLASHWSQGQPFQVAWIFPPNVGTHTPSPKLYLYLQETQQPHYFSSATPTSNLFL